ncbi:MAG: S1C family serine protease [Gammaproteobacteria bacterium]
MSALQEKLPLEINRVLDAVVSVYTHIPEDAMTADLLGTERSGYGVVIRDDGLIVTIGYLVNEAESIWIGPDRETMVPAYVIGHDYDSGFGLVKPTMPLNLPNAVLGRAAQLEIGDTVFVAGGGGARETIKAQVMAKQEFAGRWEYVLDEAIYTAPAHPSWAGAALLNRRGQLCGTGSLLIRDRVSETAIGAVNMFVPVDILSPILDEMCRFGRRQTPPRPWLGMLVHDENDQLIIAGVYRNCPADKAGLLPGDILVAVNGESSLNLANFFRRVWGLGSAGVEVPLTLLRDGDFYDVIVQSADHTAFLRKETVN